LASGQEQLGRIGEGRRIYEKLKVLEVRSVGFDGFRFSTSQECGE
jgi:hypothetical protein